MKRVALLSLLFIFLANHTFAATTVFSQNELFGLKDAQNNIIVTPKYKKLIRLGESAWVMQNKNKFGIINNNGEVLVEPKYTKAERVLSKYVKLGVGNKLGLFDEMGFAVLPVEYTSIDLLYGGMLLTCKNYKYGICDYNGQVILDNIFDDIYMPKPNVMVIEYHGQTYQVTGCELNKDELTLSFNQQNSNITITEVIANPLAATGYYGVSATDYILKIFSSLSPAYEQSIDELMFSKGADAAPIIMKFTWLPKFPIVYLKNYFQTLITPNNGPLSNIKKNLKKSIKD